MSAPTLTSPAEWVRLHGTPCPPTDATYATAPVDEACSECDVHAVVQFEWTAISGLTRATHVEPAGHRFEHPRTSYACYDCLPTVISDVDYANRCAGITITVDPDTIQEHT